MNSFKQFEELLLNIEFEPKMILVVGVIIAAYVIECILLSKGYINTKHSNKKVEKAKKMNHIIKSKRISYWNDYTSTDDSTTSYYHAKYEYTVNNKKKKYSYLSKMFPPLTLELYYIHNPNRAFHNEEKTSIFVVLIYIIPFILGIIVMKLLGVQLQ